MEDELFEPIRISADLFAAELGAEALKSEWIDCQEVLVDVASALRSFAHAKGLQLEIVAPATQIKIHTDRRALCKILFDLLETSIRITENGGISVQLHRRMHGHLGKISTDFSVEASRPDVQPEDQSTLFRLFEPLDRAKSGLSLSLTLAGLLGGRIEMADIPGGSRILRLVILGE
jgi:signal transduction histidine kinase